MRLDTLPDMLHTMTMHTGVDHTIAAITAFFVFVAAFFAIALTIALNTPTTGSSALLLHSHTSHTVVTVVHIHRTARR